jgi:putative hydrolase of the HAD superfamily
MMERRPFDLVVFDLGGVLVRVARSWTEAERLAGLPAASPTEGFESDLVEAFAALQRGSTTAEEFYRSIAASSADAYTAVQVEAIHSAWSREQYPGVEAVFDALDAVGVPTAVLSNTSAPHWSRLAALNAAVPEYSVVLRAKYHFASHLIGLLKPDRAVFDHVARTTDVLPQRILFFDDVEEYVAAARDAGWRAERIDPAADTAAQLLGHLRARGVLASIES